ncbi:hypothetical protein VTJ49DRAFT_2014 [Mycothermus thermophilus]|uniref:Peptidase A1 domain-containing protein n=1 Tax=Humicola insolens TaxID=85995 RepID=A0ABR3VB56_HUMIN
MCQESGTRRQSTTFTGPRPESNPRPPVTLSSHALIIPPPLVPWTLTNPSSELPAFREAIGDDDVNITRHTEIGVGVLTLWAAAVHAFFPFIPDGHCAPDEDCHAHGSESKRSGFSDPALPEGITVPVYHVPTITRDPTKADPVTVAASRIARKYARPQPSAPTKLEKRDNVYEVSEPLPPTESNSAGIFQYGPDYSYFIRVQVGTPSQSMFMLLDTGAANTWMMGAKCQSAACKLHDTYDASASKTWKTTADFFGIQYGSGNVSGSVGTDAVSFAGLTVPEMSFGLASHVNDSFKHFAFDGILGLGMGDSVTGGNFLGHLKSQKVLDSLVLGIALNRGSDGINDGQVTFGGVDHAKYTGEITYSTIAPPQQAKGEWAIIMDGVSFNGKSAGSTDMLAYIDTGTSFIFAPPADLDELFKLVPGASSYDNNRYREYEVPCDTTTPIVLTFAGVPYEILPADWIMRKNDKCVSNLYGWEVRPGTGSWLLGDTFLKNVYSVFDADKKRIGFAHRAQHPDTPTGSSSAVSSTTTSTLAGDDSSHPVMPGSTSEQATGAAQATTAGATAAQVNVGSRVGDGLLYAGVLCVAALAAML